MRVKVVTVMRWYVQDEVNQDYSEQNEVDGMKKGADTGYDICNSVIIRWRCGLQNFNWIPGLYWRPGFY